MRPPLYPAAGANLSQAGLVGWRRCTVASPTLVVVLLGDMRRMQRLGSRWLVVVAALERQDDRELAARIRWPRSGPCRPTWAKAGRPAHSDGVSCELLVVRCRAGG
jgi:hypothetical protein